MSKASHSLSAQDARLILDVDEGVGDAELRRAFREAVKQAHPDRPGGDDERLRQVIEAYRVLSPKASLKSDTRRKPNRRPRMPLLTITPEDAVVGGWRSVRLDDGRTINLHLPAGVREAERLSVDGRVLAVSIAGDANASVLGDHLCLTVEVEPSLLSQGGRIVIDTPTGPHTLWVTGGDAVRGLVRVAGRGLPRRGQYAQGHLFVRLLAAADMASESQTQSKLRRFSSDWAA